MAKAEIVALKPSTLQAFVAYVRAAEAGMEPTLRGEAAFLWSDLAPERAQRVRDGHILAELWSGDEPVKISDGLIHDWVGAVFIPGATLKRTLALVQDYDNHKQIYQPEVVDSALLSHHDNDFQIHLRLLKKKIITVVLDTDHDVQYRPLDRARCFCRSSTTRVAEVEQPGTARERVLSPDTGYGFLWRLNSYWRFQEKDGGVFVECRAISLTRDIPFGLGWVIQPIVLKLPRESLAATLEATRRALLA